jgi:serine/threonine protein kinase
MKEQQGLMWEQHGPEGARSEAAGIKHFGNYDLVRPIDTGGMGEVYLAHQRTAFGREVAVKIIRSDLVHDITARKRFLREAEVSAHLKHEHILPLFEFGEQDGRLFLVTPYIEGGTLARRLQNGPLTLSEVQRLFTALVQAIAYIHKRGVIHRDLKPSNVMLDTEEGSDQIYVRLIDFGIASLQGSLASPPLTEAGHEMGTIVYMAPERANGIAAPSNDIYSLGIILYQMLTGQLPSTGQLVALPEPLEAVVRHATAGDPANRYASADELLKAFEQAYTTVIVQRPVIRSQPLLRPLAVETHSTLAQEPQTPAKPTEPRTSEENTEVAIDDQPTPKRVVSGRPLERTPRSRPMVSYTPTGSQLVWHATDMPDIPLVGRNFTQEDYNAPTTSLNAGTFSRENGSIGQQKRLKDVAVLTGPTPVAPPPITPPTKRKRSGFFVFPVLIGVVLLMIITMTVYSFQGAVSAQVTISPQVQAISRVITITARSGQLEADAGTASIPINTLRSSKSMSKTGPTSGRPFPCFFSCRRVVSEDDANNLGDQINQSLRDTITQDLNTQSQARNNTVLGKPAFTVVDSNADPSIGSQSDTVTVTLTEQGTVGYYSNSDAQSIARTLFERQIGTNYQLLNQFTRVGQAVIKGTDENGNVTMAVPIAGLEQYHISSDELQNIQNHIKGLKLSAARTFIAKQPGVDANSIIVHISYSDTMPTNTDQISVKSTNPTNFPTVQLPII